MKRLFAKLWALGQEPAQGRAYYESLLPPVPYDTATSFPLKIHQIYYGSASLSSELRANIAEICNLNPDCKYQLWDEEIEPFILKHYGEKVLDIYHKISPEYRAAQADLFRYLVLYQEGGLYLDVKSTMSKPLSSVLKPDEQAVLFHWDNLEGQAHHTWGIGHPGLQCLPRGEFLQWALLYRAGHPILREVLIEVLMAIDNYNPFVRSIGRGGVLSTTGPIVYTKAIMSCLEKYQDLVRIAELADMGLGYSIYERLGQTDLHAHKRSLSSNYWTLSSPVVASQSSVVQAMSTFVLKLYYALLDAKFRLQGKGR